MSLETAIAKPQTNFPAAHPYWAGLLLAVATIPVFLALPKPFAEQWGALLLALIGGAYVGFAARDGRRQAQTSLS
jgi:hypothetical protein